ncbi:MAG: phosphate propanoyltransferase [Oscillospiraceae bacterium]|nr:phosphate propanoyltransferase [Oscillospiraceae bacterium]
MNVIIESSARHIHLSQADLDTLFGKGHMLTNKRELSQPGQFLTEEKVRLEGPRGVIDRVSILGPVRPATQVEVSFTDARVLGVVPPVKQSGDIEGAASVKIIGPQGEVTREACIIAMRHIHMIPETAEKWGLQDGQLVSIKVPGERGLTFHQTPVRVSEKFADRMHVDYDEANAAGLAGEVVGEIVV